MGPLWSLVESDVFKVTIAAQAALAFALSMRLILTTFGVRVPGSFLATRTCRQFNVRVFEITMWLGAPWYALFGLVAGEPARGLVMGAGWLAIWLLLRRFGGDATRGFLHLDQDGPEPNFPFGLMVGFVVLALAVSPPWLLLFLCLTMIA